MQYGSRLLPFILISSIASAAFAQMDPSRDPSRGSELPGIDAPAVHETGMAEVPLPPLPFVCPALRGELSVEKVPLRRTSLDDGPAAPDQVAIAIPLSAGLSMISVPVRTESEKLAELFPNLPTGARVWTWNARTQRFVEGVDGDLPLGTGCWIYLPVPTVLLVTGQDNRSSEVPVSLQRGWNLIGVPYRDDLPRAMQRVYVQRVETGFNEAVDAGAIGRTIQTFDGDGYSEVDAGGSFKPLHGYWVYSSEPQLLELRPVMFGPGIGDSLWGMGLKWAGSGLVSAGVNFGMSSLLFNMGQGNDALIVGELQKINTRLDTIISIQASMQDQLTSLSRDLGLTREEILQSIDEAALVSPVRVALKTVYDDSNPPPAASLNYFADMAAAGQGMSVSEADKTQFANQVLLTWKFTEKFNMIYEAITKGDGSGVLDRFANKVVLSTTTPGSLKTKYAAMQAYFNDLIGLQIKCGTLVMNAYTQLAPDRANPHVNALYWKQGTFDEAIRKEVEVFRTVVARIAMSQAVLPVSANDRDVALPDTLMVQPASGGSKPEGNILWMADYLAANLLNEPPGLRIRAITSPDIAPAPLISWEGPDNGTQQLPNLDQWKTVQGKYRYDSWSYSGTYPNGLRQFRFTTDWKVNVTNLGSAGAGTYQVALMPSGDDIAWWQVWVRGAGLIQEPVTVGEYDLDGDPETPPQLFGSVTVARRPDAAQMLHPCFDQTTTAPDVVNTCSATLSPSARGERPHPCDRISVAGCTVSKGTSAGTSIRIPFKYIGTERAVGRFWAHGAFTQDGCFGQSSSFWNIHLAEGLSYLDQVGGYGGPTMTHDPMDAWAYCPEVVWKPDVTYNLNMTMAVSVYTQTCPAILKYQNALICPGPAVAGEADCTQRSMN